MLQEAQAHGRCGEIRKPEAHRLRPGSSEHPHLGLGTEHPLLIGGQDHGLLAGQVVRLGADVPFSIKEQNPQQPASGIKELH